MSLWLKPTLAKHVDLDRPSFSCHYWEIISLVSICAYSYLDASHVASRCSEAPLQLIRPQGKDKGHGLILSWREEDRPRACANWQVYVVKWLVKWYGFGCWASCVCVQPLDWSRGNSWHYSRSKNSRHSHLSCKVLLCSDAGGEMCLISCWILLPQMLNKL